jgi:CRISPR system Cascade subunit CasC
MTPRFLQLHTLTSYPGALLNRDDAGFAKRLPFGGVTRTRVSSQCLKRHWRLFKGPHGLVEMDRPESIRSRLSFERYVFAPLVNEGIAEPLARAVTASLMNRVLGAKDKVEAEPKKKKGAKAAAAEVVTEPAPEAASTELKTSQLTVLGRAELDYLLTLARAVCTDTTDPKTASEAVKTRLGKEGVKNLAAMKNAAGLDAALFGRMVTGDILARGDAALHVAHAFTVHAEHSETDYFTAVDDLQGSGEDDAHGSAHINTQELTSGLFYGYVVVDVPLLIANLEGGTAKDSPTQDKALASQVIEKVIHLVTKVSPGAKLGSTAPHGYAQLLLAETGNEQPRTLANAFLKPVATDARHPDLLENAFAALGHHLRDLDQMYGAHGERQLAALGDVPGLRDALRIKETMSIPALASWAAQQVKGT